MKKFLIKASLLPLSFLMCSSIYAERHCPVQQKASILHDISVTNKSDKDIAYRVISKETSNNLYGLRHGKRDVYHAKLGDDYATFEVGNCVRINRLSGLCVELDASTLKNCVSNVHYDVYHIRDITINSSNACAVTCSDGSKTSCIVN